MTQPILAVRDGNGAAQTINTIGPNGQSNMAGSQPVTMASDQVLNIVSVNPATILAGQQAGTTAAVALPANVLNNGIIIKALPSNTGIIYVGPAGVTSATGYPLAAGEAISYGATNGNAIFIIGAVGSVAWTGN